MHTLQLFRSALILLCINLCASSKMLLVFPGGTRSHKIFYTGIVEALAEKGHQMTVISPFKPSTIVPNVREVVLSVNYAEQFLSNPFTMSTTEMLWNMMVLNGKGCVDSFYEEKVQEVLKEEFDLFLLPFVFAECYLPYVHEKKVPFVYVFPNSAAGPLTSAIGDLELPSIVPNMFMESSHPMTFRERIIGALTSVTGHLFTFHLMNSYTEAECRARGITDSNTPSITELQKQASLVIVNVVRPLEYPQRPHSPTVIFAGGIHINPKGQIPKDIHKWMDDAGDNGFILFSLGSYAKASQLKPEHLQILLNVFRSLKQRILWKCDLSEIEGLPSNVKLSDWLPQQDVLAHPKIRLFVTHGGLLSTQEAAYFGVPVVCMPIFGDQQYNTFQITLEGWGRRVNWETLTEEDLRTTIEESLLDKSLRETLARRSKLMKDLPKSPAEEAVYWIEYVIRHNGAYHLQTPLRNMAWYQIYNTDVWVTLILALALVLYLLMLLVKLLFRCCFRRKQVKIKKN